MAKSGIDDSSAGRPGTCCCRESEMGLAETPPLGAAFGGVKRTESWGPSGASSCWIHVAAAHLRTVPNAAQVVAAMRSVQKVGAAAVVVAAEAALKPYGAQQRTSKGAAAHVTQTQATFWCCNVESEHMVRKINEK